MGEEELKAFKAVVQADEHNLVDIGEKTIRAIMVEQINILPSIVRNLSRIEEPKNDPKKLKVLLAQIREDLKRKGIIKN